MITISKIVLYDKEKTLHFLQKIRYYTIKSLYFKVCFKSVKIFVFLILESTTQVFKNIIEKVEIELIKFILCLKGQIYIKI